MRVKRGKLSLSHTYASFSVTFSIWRTCGIPVNPHRYIIVAHVKHVFIAWIRHDNMQFCSFFISLFHWNSKILWDHSYNTKQTHYVNGISFTPRMKQEHRLEWPITPRRGITLKTSSSYMNYSAVWLRYWWKYLANATQLNNLLTKLKPPYRSRTSHA